MQRQPRKCNRDQKIQTPTETPQRSETQLCKNTDTNTEEISGTCTQYAGIIFANKWQMKHTTLLREQNHKKERRKGVVNLKMNKNLLFQGKKKTGQQTQKYQLI